MEIETAYKWIVSIFSFALFGWLIWNMFLSDIIEEIIDMIKRK